MQRSKFKLQNSNFQLHLILSATNTRIFKKRRVLTSLLLTFNETFEIAKLELKKFVRLKRKTKKKKTNKKILMPCNSTSFCTF